jgi:hypothetical protein
LLQQALEAFTAADAALKQNPPDYNTYGQKLQQAEQLVAQAQALLGGPTTTIPTTVPGGGSA